MNKLTKENKKKPIKKYIFFKLPFFTNFVERFLLNFRII